MSLFEIEQSLKRPGMSAEIRHYGWSQECESFFEPDHFYMELGLARRGTASLLGPDRQHYETPGPIVALSSGVHFRTRCEPSEHRSLCVMVDTTAFPSLFDSALDGQDYAPFCQDVRDPHVERCLVRLLEEVRNPGFASDILADALVGELIVEVHRYLRWRKAAAAEAGGKLAPWRMKRLKERIDEDLGQQLTIAKLASELDMSVRHLVRTFKNTEGVTLSDYIAGARVNRARHKLCAESVLIKQLAHECGFQTSSAFSTAFRKATGETPRQFRERVTRSQWAVK